MMKEFKLRIPALHEEKQRALSLFGSIDLVDDPRQIDPPVPPAVSETFSFEPNRSPFDALLSTEPKKVRIQVPHAGFTPRQEIENFLVPARAHFVAFGNLPFDRESFQRRPELRSTETKSPFRVESAFGPPKSEGFHAVIPSLDEDTIEGRRSVPLSSVIWVGRHPADQADFLDPSFGKRILDQAKRRRRHEFPLERAADLETVRLAIDRRVPNRKVGEVTCGSL